MLGADDLSMPGTSLPCFPTLFKVSDPNYTWMYLSYFMVYLICKVLGILIILSNNNYINHQL